MARLQSDKRFRTRCLSMWERHTRFIYTKTKNFIEKYRAFVLGRRTAKFTPLRKIRRSLNPDKLWLFIISNFPHWYFQKVHVQEDTVLRKDLEKGGEIHSGTRKSNLEFYGKNEGEQFGRLDLIESQFINTFTDLDTNEIHNYYLCKDRNCSNIGTDKQFNKDNKFLHKWIFDPEISLCPHTGIWSLTYIDNKEMFCALCKMLNTKQPTND